MKRTLVILLAYLHACLPTVLTIIGAKAGIMLPFAGFGSLLFAAWEWIGCIRKWDHIYCIHQKWRKLDMTPEAINWDTFPRSSCFGLGLLFTAVGIMFFAIHFYIGA